jgi:hypothetical protein
LNNQVKTPSQNSELPKESNTDKITNPEVKPFKQTNNQSPQQNIISKEDKDLQDRAKIFRSF